MSTPVNYETDVTWIYSGKYAIQVNSSEDENLNRQVARVGDVLLDDGFDVVTLLGRNTDGGVTIRKADGDIIDRTT
eukprot:5122818-Pleurochrysis_carterae.AAC.1